MNRIRKDKKGIVCIGLLFRARICSREMWDKYNDLNIDFDLIAEKMSDLGI